MKRDELVRAAGVEPTTCGFGGRHSIQLSYARTNINHTDIWNLVQHGPVPIHYVASGRRSQVKPPSRGGWPA